MGLLLGNLLARFSSTDVAAVVLMSGGFISALVNGASFQVLRRIDEPPSDGMSRSGRERITRKLESRRRTFCYKWAGAVVTSALAMLAGALARIPSLSSSTNIIVMIGFMLFCGAVTLGILIAVEYCAVSRLARDLPRRVQAEKRKQDLLGRLGAKHNVPRCP